MTTTTKTNAFGDYFKGLRAKRRVTLRAFAREHGFDAGNLSRIERGVLPPPGREPLELYAEALGLIKGSDEWYHLFDLASAQAGHVPVGISEEDLVEKLPLFFRTLRQQRVDPDAHTTLVELIRKQYS